MTPLNVTEQRKWYYKLPREAQDALHAKGQEYTSTIKRIWYANVAIDGSHVPVFVGRTVPTQWPVSSTALHECKIDKAAQDAIHSTRLIKDRIKAMEKAEQSRLYILGAFFVAVFFIVHTYLY